MIHHAVYVYRTIHDLAYGKCPWIILVGTDVQLKRRGEVEPRIGRQREAIKRGKIMKREFLLIVSSCGVQLDRRVARIEDEARQSQP